MEQALAKLRAESALPPIELSKIIVEEAVRLTGSALGYFAITDDTEAQLTMLAWSQSAMAICSTQEMPIEYPVVATGIWGDCIRERAPVITNDYPNCTRVTKKGYPEGHVPVLRHMNVPVFSGTKIMGILGVGNRETEYSPADAELLQAFANAAWPIFAPAKERLRQ